VFKAVAYPVDAVNPCRYQDKTATLFKTVPEYIYVPRDQARLRGYIQKSRFPKESGLINKLFLESLYQTLCQH
jgi:hypothetical protein